MTESRIKDNPTYSKPLSEAQQMTLLLNSLPLLRALNLVDDQTLAELEALRPKLAGLISELDHLSSLPDRFNAAFAQAGWIMYADMSTDVAADALNAADAGDFGRAEQLLTDYYSPGLVRSMIARMIGVRAFRERKELAQLALADYESGRYHASIPVILLLIDGIVSDVGADGLGFFAEKVDLTAWDSVAGHSTGLQVLSGIMRRGFNKTIYDEITVPYRNGIMHGRTPNYANPLVAAKSWATLFAIREWALKIQNGQKDAPPAQPPPSLTQIVDAYRAVQAEVGRFRAWQPRAIAADAPAYRVDVNPEELEASSPERWLVEYLHLWKRGNYGHMLRYIDRNPEKILGAQPAAEVRKNFGHRRLTSFQIQNINDSNYCTCDITVRIDWLENGEARSGVFERRLIYEDSTGNFVTPGNPDGRWFIVLWRLA